MRGLGRLSAGSEVREVALQSRRRYLKTSASVRETEWGLGSAYASLSLVVRRAWALLPGHRSSGLAVWAWLQWGCGPLAVGDDVCSLGQAVAACRYCGGGPVVAVCAGFVQQYSLDVCIPLRLLRLGCADDNQGTG